MASLVLGGCLALPFCVAVDGPCPVGLGLPVARLSLPGEYNSYVTGRASGI